MTLGNRSASMIYKEGQSELSSPHCESVDAHLKVSVCVITFNHVKYIREAIEGVMAQSTNFEFEVLIGEDSSTDGTYEIALEYQKKYPNIIKIIKHERKDVVYVNGRATGRWNFFDTLAKSRGKYVAYVEGDDYWTDPFKLQKQVDLLESRPDLMMCGHWVINVNSSNELLEAPLFTGKIAPVEFTAKEALLSTILHPNSWLFRNFDLSKHPAYPVLLRLPAADDPLLLVILAGGGGCCIQEFMSAYRVHEGGTWSTKSDLCKEFEMLQFRLSSTGLVCASLLPRVILSASYDLTIFLGSIILKPIKVSSRNWRVKEFVILLRTQTALSKTRLSAFTLLSLALLPAHILLFSIKKFNIVFSKWKSAGTLLND